MTSEGGLPPNFGGHFLGAEMEIQKSHRRRELYCPKLQLDTPYDQIGPLVLAVRWGATGFDPSSSYILVYSVNNFFGISLIDNELALLPNSENQEVILRNIPK